MARLPYLDKADLAPEDADILARGINLHRVLANNPGAARAFTGLGQYIRHRTVLDPRLRELAILQVGWLARSAYEWSHHIKIGHDFGVSDADIEALVADTRGEPSALDGTARLVLRAAREIHDGPGVSAATFTALRGAFGPAEITDLVTTASFYCAVVRLLASLEVDVEEGYMPYLQRHPLPG
ncbi:MAG: carboxymuconolactone decarboxylase family protein [Acetobacteraceae bacterium]|nr:carboxymuconolactone decarboxylase family protein [Acetobacteraceae bacterium]